MSNAGMNYKNSYQMGNPKSFNLRPNGAKIDLNTSKVGLDAYTSDSESTYMELILEGKADHTIYGKLGALRGMQTDTMN